MNASNSKTRYFLFELIVNCLFFAISASVCLELFAFGLLQNEESRNLSMATLESQSVAEAIKATQGDVGLLAEVLQGEVSGETIVLFYNSDWQRSTPEEGSVYTLTIRFTQEGGGMQRADITVNHQSATVYELSLLQYMAGEAIA